MHTHLEGTLQEVGKTAAHAAEHAPRAALQAIIVGGASGVATVPNVYPAAV